MDFTEKGFDYGSKICSTLISAFPGTSAPCVFFFSFLILNWHVLKYVLQIALALTNGLYESIVERGDVLIERERQEATRQNIDTIHGNIIQTFNLGQQLKTLLGGVLEGLNNNDKDDEDRRRLAVNCEDKATNGTCLNATSVSCKDPKLLCDGVSVNWNYVALLQFGEISTICPICFPSYQSVFLLACHKLQPVVMKKSPMEMKERQQTNARIVTRPR